MAQRLRRRWPASRTWPDSWRRCAASGNARWCASPGATLRAGPSLAETLADTSAFADAAIEAAVEYASQDLARTYGEPRSAAGERSRFIVLGMGKLGGGELNFSSDIDLIFVFPDKGTTAGARCIDNEDFFTRLGRLVIRLLGERTAEGSVFRVDMRLRPFGDSGPLTASGDVPRQLPADPRPRLGALRLDQGARHHRHRRPTSSIHAESVRPFVYRRYLDFGVFEALREMKALIEKEVARRDLAEHVKLGPGGIREIEFIVQAFQLIRGGQDRRMQTPSLLAVLPQLAGGKLLPARVAQELEAAYRVPAPPRESPADAGRCSQAHTIPDGRARRASVSRSPWAFDDWDSLRRRARPASRAASRAHSRKSCSRATRPRRPRCRASMASSTPGCAVPKGRSSPRALEARGFTRSRPRPPRCSRVSRQRHACAGSTRRAARGSIR